MFHLGAYTMVSANKETSELYDARRFWMLNINAQALVKMSEYTVDFQYINISILEKIK